MPDVKRITPADNLATIVDQINAATWDRANAISCYDVESLTAYLERQDTLFLTCHSSAEAEAIFLGMASARFELKPYGGERWLYVDEVDVCADQRRRGAGRALMEKLISLAAEAGCEEVWLGTEVDNAPANALYRALDPDDVAQVLGYTWELDADD